MIEGIYGPPGGASLRGAVYAWSSEGARRGADLPEWLPDVDADSVEAFDEGPPATGPSAPNMIGGGDFPVAAEFDPPGSAFDIVPGQFDVDAAIDDDGGYSGGAVPPNIVLGDK